MALRTKKNTPSTSYWVGDLDVDENVQLVNSIPESGATLKVAALLEDGEGQQGVESRLQQAALNMGTRTLSEAVEDGLQRARLHEILSKRVDWGTAHLVELGRGQCGLVGARGRCRLRSLHVPGCLERG
eukprot:6488009-Amphidinium_carterae.1